MTKRKKISLEKEQADDNQPVTTTVRETIDPKTFFSEGRILRLNLIQSQNLDRYLKEQNIFVVHVKQCMGRLWIHEQNGGQNGE